MSKKMSKRIKKILERSLRLMGGELWTRNFWVNVKADKTSTAAPFGGDVTIGYYPDGESDVIKRRFELPEFTNDDITGPSALPYVLFAPLVCDIIRHFHEPTQKKVKRYHHLRVKDNPSSKVKKELDELRPFIKRFYGHNYSDPSSLEGRMDKYLNDNLPPSVYEVIDQSISDLQGIANQGEGVVVDIAHHIANELGRFVKGGVE